MRTKFNYIAYLLCLLLCLGFFAFFFVGLNWFKIIYTHEKNKIAVCIGIIIGFIGLIYGVIVSLDLLINYRRKFIFTNEALIIIDPILFRKEVYEYVFIQTIIVDEVYYDTLFRGIEIKTKSGKSYKMINIFTFNFSRVKKDALRIKKVKQIPSK